MRNSADITVAEDMTDKRFNNLIRESKSGKAFEELYAWFYPKIVSHIYYKFGSRHLGEEVAQEFFLRLIRRPPPDYIKKPTAWVYTVCDNIARDMLSSEKNYNAAYAQGENSPDDAFEKLLYGEYKRQIEELDDDSRKIVTMHFYEGYSLREIADLLGKNYNTVRQKCARALKKLKKSQKS